MGPEDKPFILVKPSTSQLSMCKAFDISFFHVLNSRLYNFTFI